MPRPASTYVSTLVSVLAEVIEGSYILPLLESVAVILAFQIVQKTAKHD